MNATLPTPEFQAELDVEIAADQIDALATEQTDIEQELEVAEAPPQGSLSLEETIMQQGRRSDGEVVVKLNEEQIKEKHDQFHEIYRKQVLDSYEFGELRKEFNSRKKLRETDMAKLDNCILRGEETQCVTRWRIPAYKLSHFLAFSHVAEESKELAFIFDSDFDLIDRVPLTEMERQMQIEYEDSASTAVQDGVAEVVSEDSPEEEEWTDPILEAEEESEEMEDIGILETDGQL